MSLLPFFTSRYSCKRFDVTKKVSHRDIEVLIETARLAPCALGIPVVRLLHIQDENLRAELRKHALPELRAFDLHQSQVTDASDLFIFAVKTSFTQKDIDDFIALTAETKQVSLASLENQKKQIELVISTFTPASFLEWSQRQAYTALGFVLSQCAVLGLESCPLGLFDAKKYNELLGLDSLGLHTTTLLAVGYRDESDTGSTAPKVRIGRDKFLLSHI